MFAYVYQAALYCEPCGEAIRSRLQAPADPDCFDSGDYPAGPYPAGGGEADSPQHCEACGEFLRNPLTGDGIEYVRGVVERLGNLSAAQRERCGAAAELWAEHYRAELAAAAGEPGAAMPRVKIGKAWTQWFVVPPGPGGGIPVADRAAAFAMCEARGWLPVDGDGRPVRKPAAGGS